ncbi:MAG TPA: DoxX family protein [Candidatus Limnocylindrales bacterium]|nr:DoxX family protein [Candidatus Limnocylindrales bacterium]
MNTALWIIAGVLATAFLAGGLAKIIFSRDKLLAFGRGAGEDFIGWMRRFPPGAVKAIGVLEILAAVGLILPAAVGIAPVLVPLAATGLVLLMAGAMITHLRHREVRPFLGNIAYLALAAFVAWGRFGPESFTG